MRTLNSFHIAALFNAPAAGGGGSFPAGATHHWAFENNLNDSIGAFTLVDDGVESYPAGKHNLCVRFFSDMMCVLGGSADSSDSLPFDSAFSVACWMKVESGSTMNFIDSGGTIYIEYGFGGEARASVDGAETNRAGLTDNTWHLFVLVYDGSNCKLSADGDSFTSVAAGAPAAGTFRFLSSATTGNFDEATFWPLALAQSDVTTLWNGGSGTFP